MASRSLAFTVIMDREFTNGCPQGIFSELNHPVEACLLDAPNEAFGIAIQVRDGSLTDLVPASASADRNSAVNCGPGNELGTSCP